MTKINLILLTFFLFLSFLTPSFASVRAEAIDETLRTTELAQSIKKSVDQETREQYPNPSGYTTYYTDNQDTPISPSQTAEDKKRFYISAGYNANHLHYKEFSGGDTLDEDYGKLNGFYIAGGYRNNNYKEWLLGKFFIEGYFRRYDAEITYDGSSALGPCEFKERWEAQRFGLKLGASRDIWDKGEFFGYFDIGHNTWYRGENEVIDGVLTYAEKYWWTFVGLGTGVNYEFMPKLTIGIEGEFMFAPGNDSAGMRADLYEGGTFKLGGVWGGELKIPVKYRILKNLSLDVTPYFTYWRIRASDSIIISGTSYYEPDSRTHIEGVMAGLTLHF